MPRKIESQRIVPSRPSLASGLVEAKLAPADFVVAPGRLEDAVHEHPRTAPAPEDGRGTTQASSTGAEASDRAPPRRAKPSQPYFPLPAKHLERGISGFSLNHKTGERNPGSGIRPNRMPSLDAPEARCRCLNRRAFGVRRGPRSRLPGSRSPGPDTPSGEAISRLYWIVLGLCARSSSSSSRRRSSSSSSASAAGATRLRAPRGRRSTATPGSRSSGRRSPRSFSLRSRSSRYTQIPAVQARGVEDEAHSDGPGRGAPVLLEYRYPDGETTVNTLYLPVDEPVELEPPAWTSSTAGGFPPSREDGCHPRPHQLSALRPRGDRRLRGQVRRALRRPARVHADHGHRPEPGRVRVKLCVAAGDARAWESDLGRRVRYVSRPGRTGDVGPSIAGNAR